MPKHALRQRLSRVTPLSVTIVLLFAAAMSYFLLGAFAATGPATLYTSPGGTKSVTTGQTFTVSVRIGTASNVPVTGASVYLSYPASKLQVTGESYGGPYNTQLVASNSGGILRMDRAAFPMISGGDQLFAQVTFKAIATGAAPISFTGSSIVTSGDDDSNLLGQRNGVTYTVSAPATPPHSSSGSSGSSSRSSGSKPSSAGGGSSSSNSGSKSGTSGSAGSGASNSGSHGGSSTPSTGSQAGPSQQPGNKTPSDTSTPDTATQAAATSSVQITVLDSDNKPVEGAEVVVNGQTVKTDKDGAAYFDSVPVGMQKVTVKYHGRNTSKSVTVQNTPSPATPQLLKVSITRNKFNPMLVLVPVVVLVLAGLLLIRPWDKWLRPSFANDDVASMIVSSDSPHAMTSPPEPVLHSAASQPPVPAPQPPQAPAPEQPPNPAAPPATVVTPSQPPAAPPSQPPSGPERPQPGAQIAPGDSQPPKTPPAQD